MRRLTTLIIVFIFTLAFSGCSTYYSTTSKTKTPEVTQEEIHVRVQTTQEDWSIVCKLPDEAVDFYAKAIVDKNPLFVNDENSTNILQIDIFHSNDNGVLELVGAAVTGASLYIIPSGATTDVTIKISLNEFKTKYEGELGFAGGMAQSLLVDKSKYTVGSSRSILNQLIINALDEFTIAYLKQ